MLFCREIPFASQLYLLISGVCVNIITFCRTDRIVSLIKKEQKGISKMAVNTIAFLSSIINEISAIKEFYVFFYFAIKFVSLLHLVNAFFLRVYNFAPFLY
jgi:hypothetical protein